MNAGSSTDKLKRPFMPMRDGAGSFDLDNPDDGTPIKEMISLSDRLFLITEKCTYEVQLADQIDPNRTNPSLPHNVRRKLFDYGVRSEPLVKTFLQSDMLFKQNHLAIDRDVALKLAIEAVHEFDAMEKVMKGFVALETGAIEAAEKAKHQPRSIALPSIGGIDSYCKTFTQKAHHFDRALLSIVRLLLPAATNWDKLHEIVRSKFGKADPFDKLLADAIPNLKLVLNLRDALEHQNKGATVRDFSMEPDGSIAPPTVELNFRKSILPRCSVSSLMDGLIAALPIYFEMMIVHLSSKFVRSVGGLPLFVDLLPDTFQATKYVRFGYYAKMPDGQMLPFG